MFELVSNTSRSLRHRLNTRAVILLQYKHFTVMSPKVRAQLESEIMRDLDSISDNISNNSINSAGIVKVVLLFFKLLMYYVTLYF
jgi:hypothetical protein